MDFFYLSLSLVLPSHDSLPFFTIPHTRMLHHCIPSTLRTNQGRFHRLTPLSYHSACHSPPLTHTSRETHRPSVLELADLPPTTTTTTPLSHVRINSFSHMHTHREVELRQTGAWSPRNGPGGNAVQCKPLSQSAQR